MPYCTNLMPVCGANIVKLRNLASVSPQLAKLIRETVEPRQMLQVCQGAITLTIKNDGQAVIDPEFDAPCSFRGDYKRLLL